MLQKRTFEPTHPALRERGGDMMEEAKPAILEKALTMERREVKGEAQGAIAPLPFP